MNNDLSNIHPTLTITGSQIVVHEKINTYLESGDLEERDILVSTSGTFIIKSRIFPKQLKLQNLIPHCDISKIIVSSNSITILSNENSINFQCKNQYEIAQKIAAIRSSLFDPKIFPLSIIIDELVQEKYSTYQFCYESDSLIADRFLSYVINSSQPLFSDKIERVYQYLANSSGSLEISKTSSELMYFEEYIKAISLEKSINEITITNLPSKYIDCIVLELLFANSFIRKIAFIDCTIKGNQTEHVKFIKSPKFHIQHIYYENCDFTEEDFLFYISAFLHCTEKIKVLAIDKCKFTKESLDALFQSIVISPCFHFLEILRLTGIKFPEMVDSFARRLVQSNWLNTRVLSLAKCGIDNSIIFTNKNLSSSYLDLSGNYFSYIPDQMSYIISKPLILSLSKCKMTDQQIVQLATILSKRNNCFFSLNFSKIENSDVLLKSKLTIPGLYSLSWKGNSINAENIDYFVDFIKLNKSICMLKLDNCLSNETIVIQKITELLSSMHLTHLSLESTNSYPLTTNAAVISIAALSGDCLVSLDVKGQEIGAGLLKSLVNSFTKSMKEFAFEGNGVDDGEALTEILDSLIAKRLTHVSMPPSFEVASMGIKDKIKDFRIPRTHSEKIEVMLETAPIIEPPIQKGDINNFQLIEEDDEYLELLKECVIIDPIAPARNAVSNAVKKTSFKVLTQEL